MDKLSPIVHVRGFFCYAVKEVREMRKEDPIKPRYTMKENSRYMFQLAWQQRKSVIFIMLSITFLSVIVQLLELFITPILLQQIETKASLYTFIKWLILFVLLLMSTKGGLAYLKTNTLLGRLNIRIYLISQLSQKMQQTSYPNLEDTRFLEKYESANYSVMTNGSATEIFWETMSKIIQNFFIFVIYLFLLSHLDVTLALLVGVTAVCSFFYHQRKNKQAQLSRFAEEKLMKEINYIQQKGEDFSYAKDIRLFQQKSWLKEIYQTAFSNYQKLMLKKESYYLQANLADIGLNFVRNGIVYAYLLYLSMSQSWLVSEFLLYFLAISGFSQGIQMILTEMSNLNKHSLDINHLRDFLETEELFLFEEGKSLTADKHQSYEISLRGLSFTYPGAKKATFEDLNLTFHAGESVAIVGLNGAGKTTLVKIICGFLDPTHGEVLLNGINIKEYNRRDYYRLFSAVFQQFSVIETTILENITQGENPIQFEKAKDCIQLAGLQPMIERLPQGLNTLLGKKVYEKGIELSGGQIQRLMLARALYKEAPMLVLDEPTAALDPIAENDIYQKYHQLTKGHLAIFISHRLASTRFCDRVLYIEEGKVIEEGTHEDLMQKNGKYKALFEVQSKYYQEEVEVDGEVKNESITDA